MFPRLLIFLWISMLYNTISEGFRSVQIKHTVMSITVYRRKTRYISNCHHGLFVNPLSGLFPPCLFVFHKQEARLIALSFLCFGA